eukprot:5079975-Heterocapsa_arctica.AAC.1
MLQRQEFLFEDWFGNNEADIQAKQGAEKHGYSQYFTEKVVVDNVDLTKSVQQHMISTYQRYITDPLVRKDVITNIKIKGTPSVNKGRPTIRPEQLGHDVHVSCKFEYCLGCGRSTKAAHIATASVVFWKRQLCNPVDRLEIQPKPT